VSHISPAPPGIAVANSFCAVDNSAADLQKVASWRYRWHLIKIVYLINLHHLCFSSEVYFLAKELELASKLP